MYSFRTFAQIRKRIRQKATLYSLLVVVLLFGLFLEAYMHNFNLVYITLFFVFAIAFAAGPIGLLNIGLLYPQYLRSSRLFAQRAGEIFYSIDNRYTHSAWAITFVCDGHSYPLDPLPPHQSTTIKLPITPLERGYFTLRGCSLETLFPLSSARLVLRIEESVELLIYPEPKGRPLGSFIQEHLHPFGEERDFEGLSPYSGSESLSRIHWPSIAKGEPSIKTFERYNHHDILIFRFEEAGEGNEERLSQLCLWVLECEATHRPFILEMPHRRLDSTKEDIDAILRSLALY